MNCKPGDLAVYVGSDLNDLGRIVTVLEPSHFGSMVLGEQYWVVDPPLRTSDGLNYALAVADRALRPIRPGEGDDETLAWAGKPEQVAA